MSQRRAHSGAGMGEKDAGRGATAPHVESHCELAAGVDMVLVRRGRVLNVNAEGAEQKRLRSHIEESGGGFSE